MHHQRLEFLKEIFQIGFVVGILKVFLAALLSKFPQHNQMELIARCFQQNHQTKLKCHLNEEFFQFGF